MTVKLLSLVLLGISFGIGAMTTDGPAIQAGSPLASGLVTFAVVLLLFFGIYGWYRMVRGAAELQDWKVRELHLSRRVERANAHSS